MVVIEEVEEVEVFITSRGSFLNNDETIERLKDKWDYKFLLNLLKSDERNKVMVRSSYYLTGDFKKEKITIRNKTVLLCYRFLRVLSILCNYLEKTHELIPWWIVEDYTSIIQYLLKKDL